MNVIKGKRLNPKNSSTVSQLHRHSSLFVLTKIGPLTCKFWHSSVFLGGFPHFWANVLSVTALPTTELYAITELVYQITVCSQEWTQRLSFPLDLFSFFLIKKFNVYYYFIVSGALLLWVRFFRQIKKPQYHIFPQCSGGQAETWLTHLTKQHIVQMLEWAILLAMFLPEHYSAVLWSTGYWNWDFSVSGVRVTFG